MKKIYNEKINKHTDWGGDESTNYLPVSGFRVQEYIQNTLNSKAGLFYYDTTNNRYLVFSDEESKNTYFEDPTRTDLLLANFDAPFNYTANINLLTDSYVSILSGSVGNEIRFTFDIVNKQGISVGDNILCTFTFIRGNNKVQVSNRYRNGQTVVFNIDKYLLDGTNNIQIGIVGDTTLAATTMSVTYQVVKLSLSSDLDISKVYKISGVSNPVCEVPFTVSGYGIKTVEWYVDGEKLEKDPDTDEVTQTEATKTKYISLSALSEGVHTIQFQAYTTVDGVIYYSDIEYREIIVYNNVITNPQVSISMSGIPEILESGVKSIYGLQQYVSYLLEFGVYNPQSSNTEVEIRLGGEKQTSIVSENEVINQVVLFPKVSGESSIEFVINGETITYTTNISESPISIEEITNKLQLDFNSQGKSNNSTDKDVWAYGDYSGEFTGFNWNNTSGWVDNTLRINSGASFSINYSPLGVNPSTTGKTIEIEFASTNVNDDNAVLLDLCNEDGTGLLITATNIKLVSQAGVTIETSYKDNEFIRVVFVINRSSGVTNKCMSFIYINGIVSRCVSWASTDTYTSNVSLNFKGTDGAEMLLKSLRIYDIALTDDQILNNYTLYRESVSDMVDVYNRNDVYDENGSFDYQKMVGRLPVMIITGDIPTLEATTDKNEQITVDIDYYNLQDQERSFTMKSAAMRPQGTSSMGYPKKNFRIYTQKRDDTILYDSNGVVVKDKLYSFKKGAQPVNCWCLKADYAESSGTHNTGIARLWNKVLMDAKIDGEYLLRTEAQKAALQSGYEYDVRTTVDGFPILMFYRLSENDPLVFIGKYNFNNDKSTESVFGFEGIPGFDNSRMQCWEVLNNGNSLALFTSVENFDTAWSEAFESRYPDTSEPDTSYLKAFCTWMSSVSQANFRVQKWNHLDIYKVAAYYIYLMRFGAVDQTVKNSMFTSEDGVHFYFINYDNDTINGLINTGHLVAPWNTTRSTLGADGEPYYAGKDSRLWNMLEADEEFMSVVKKVDEALYVAGLRYDDVINMFDVEQSGKWVERVYNQDSQYKYIGPFSEKGVDNLFMLQGNRSQHRKYWLAKRFAYFDSTYVSGAYKSKSIEIKCIDNTPSGQNFTITAGVNMDYGYGINSVARASNITLTENSTHTFTTEEIVNRGDPIRIYAAPNIKGLDLSAMSDRLAVVSIDNVYDESLGTKFKELILGNAVKENVVVESISGLGRATKLEYLDVRNFKGLTSLNLSNHPNIKYVDATGSNVANIEFSKGASLQTLKMPVTMQTLRLEQLPSLSTLTSENNFMTLRGIIVKDCPYLSQNFTFIKDWRTNTQLNPEDLSLEMNNVSWMNIDPADLISLGGISSISLKGIVYVTSATQEQIDQLSAIFGSNCFDKNSDFRIVVPDGLFIAGLAEIRGGYSVDLSAAIFSDNPGTVTWSITSGSGASLSTSSGLSTTVTTTESTSDRTVTIQARHVPSGAGDITYATKTIKITKVIRVTSGSISGPSTIGGLAEYVFTPSPSDYDEDYSVTWSLSGTAATSGYVSIKSQNKESCQVQVTEKVNNSSFTVVASINNGKSTFTISKSVVIGVKLTLGIYSNQSGDEDTFSTVKATVKYGSSSTTLGNGDELNVAANTEIVITFPSVTGYKTPSKIEFVIGTEDTTKSGTYLTEQVEVNLSAYDNGDLTGTIVNIGGTNYTWQGTTLKARFAYDTSYTIKFNRVGEYLSPSNITVTASQTTRTINALYDQIPEGLVIIDQTITDPASMISGDVNSSTIQSIRSGSHRFLGKYTSEGTMTLCQLSDSDSTKYFDGSDADLTGVEGDVFMKMPAFWYRTLSIGTDVWGIQFELGEDSPGEGWIKWDTNALIGVYEAYQSDSKLYSRSGVTSSGNISQANFKTYSRNRGTGFQLVDWQMHCIMALLYYSEYGHTNCQDKIGAGTSSYSKSCGQTNSCGMNDTKGSNPVTGLNDSGVDGNSQSINFWGLENWWGNKYEWVDNVVVNSGIFSITEPDGTVRTSPDKGYYVSDYIGKFFFGDYGDLIPTSSSGSSTTGFCDYGYVTSSSTRVVLRSYYNSSTYGGVGYVSAYYDSSSTNSNYGSRLAFRGSCEIAESVSTYKAAESIG